MRALDAYTKREGLHVQSGDGVWIIIPEASWPVQCKVDKICSYLMDIERTFLFILGNPCINFQTENENITTCLPSSTWAVGLPDLTVTHVISTRENPSFRIAYDLILKNTTSIPLCIFTFRRDSCVETGSNCIFCESNRIGQSGGSVTAVIKITNLGSDEDESHLAYTFDREKIKNEWIHSFSISSKCVGITSCGYRCSNHNLGVDNGLGWADNFQPELKQLSDIDLEQEFEHQLRMKLESELKWSWKYKKVAKPSTVVPWKQGRSEPEHARCALAIQPGFK